MQNVTNALFWAAAILITAYVMRANGISEAASFTMTMALSAAALATMRNSKSKAACFSSALK